MKIRPFLRQIDHTRIVAAIGAAEQQTSAEIRVYITHHPTDDALAAAKLQFEKLGMHRTAARNGVLLLVAPRSRTFAIVGDEGIHAQGGDALWQGIAQEMAARFRAGDFTGGIVRGVEMVGASLARHFPRQENDTNELPDRVVEDGS